MPPMGNAMLYALVLACALPALAQPSAPWHELYLSGGGMWHARVPIVIANEGAADALGEPVSVTIGEGPGQANLTGKAEAVRVCNAQGEEYLFRLATPEGKPLTSGPLAPGTILTFPVDCPAGKTVVYYAYCDNERAWPVPEFFAQGKPRQPSAAKLRATVKPREELSVRDVGLGAPWLEGENVRVAIGASNTTDVARANVLVRCTVARFAAWLKRHRRNVALRVVDPVRGPIPSLLSGTELMFLADIPPRSTKHFYAYPAPGAEPQLSYAKLLAQPGNLVANASFEEGTGVPRGWTVSQGQRPGLVRLQRVAGGLFGEFCAKLEVPQGVPLAWYGWRQEVPCQPNAQYWYACYVRAENVTEGNVSLHAHFHKARGVMSDIRRHFSVSRSLVGTTDWTLLCGFMRTPTDCHFVELHLTMRARGTVYHDGVVLRPVFSASTGEIESREPQGAGLRLWAVNPLVKVFPDDPPEVQPAIVELFAARGEREVVQLALRSSHPVADLTIRVIPPTNNRGERLSEFSVWRVGYVPVDHPTAYYRSTLPPYRRRFPTTPGRSDGWAGLWPDPLLPMQSFDLPENQTHAFWVVFSVPRNASPGEYRGEIELSGVRVPSVSVPVRFVVWGFQIPEERHLKVIYDVRQGPGIRFLSAPDASRRLRQLYKLMAEHRVSTNRIFPDPKITYKDGQVTIDAQEFDRTAAYCLDVLKMNVFYTPWEFYCFGWAHPPRKFKGFAPFTPEYTRAYQACLRAFWEHLKQRGWQDKVVLYISDEPHYWKNGIVEQMQKCCKMIKEAVPEIPIYSSTWRHVPEWDGYLTIWGIGQYGCFPVEEMVARRRAGEQLWFTTDGQMCIDTPYLGTERLLPYYCFKYDVSGYEFWGISWWTFDPFKFGWHSYIRQSPEPGKTNTVRYPNGDGYLVYPGWLVGYDGFLSSVRLEQAREGIEDYECLLLLQRLVEQRAGAPRDIDYAKRVLERVRGLVTIPNAGGLRSLEIMPDPDAVLVLRKQVGEAIEKLAR